MLVPGATIFLVVVAARIEMRGSRGLKFQRGLGSGDDSGGRVKREMLLFSPPASASPPLLILLLPLLLPPLLLRFTC